jgi:ubiquinone/menaquinone biosynthesis C-methylase UbiE
VPCARDTNVSQEHGPPGLQAAGEPAVPLGGEMNPESMKPHGRALLDYFNGDYSARIAIHRDDGYTDYVAVSTFFREPSDFSQIEQTALDLCRGYVLDVGAGAGPDSLALQERGLSVCAIDISPEACEIMRIRGIREVYCTDMYDFSGGPFDTMLMLCHGLGLLGDISGLDRFLEYAHRLAKSDGQIICDSLDVRYTGNPLHLAYQQANRDAGRYFGEMRSHMEYKGKKWPLWKWLHVDPEMLTSKARKAGWSCEIVLQEDGGDYLARLTPKCAK